MVPETDPHCHRFADPGLCIPDLFRYDDIGDRHFDLPVLLGRDFTHGGVALDFWASLIGKNFMHADLRQMPY